jgi:plasmid segregation protein ParM
MILGIDIGNVYTKTSKLVYFPSKTSYNVAFENNYLLDYEGEEMLIGDGELSTDLNKTLKPNLLPLLYAGIYRSTTDTSNKVVLGLPISQVKNHKDDLKELILRNNRKNVNGRVIT